MNRENDDDEEIQENNTCKNQIRGTVLKQGEHHGLPSLPHAHSSLRTNRKSHCCSATMGVTKKHYTHKSVDMFIFD